MVQGLLRASGIVNDPRHHAAGWLLSAVAAFERDEKIRRIEEGPFQAEIVLKNLDEFTGQRQDALLVPFARDAELRLCQLEIFEAEFQDFAGAQPVEQHHAYKGEVAERSETAPELSDFFGRQGNDNTVGLPKTEAVSDGFAGTAPTEWGPRHIRALEVGMAGRNLLPVMKSVQTTNHGQAMIYGLRRGPRLLVQLMTNIVPQRGFRDGRKRLMLVLKPTSKVQQVIGVGAQRARRELTNVLGIEKIVGPGDLATRIVEQAVRTGSGG